MSALTYFFIGLLEVWEYNSQRGTTPTEVGNLLIVVIPAKAGIQMSALTYLFIGLLEVWEYNSHRGSARE